MLRLVPGGGRAHGVRDGATRRARDRERARGGTSKERDVLDDSWTRAACGGDDGAAV